MKPNRPRFFTIPRSCDAPEQTATNAASGQLQSYNGVQIESFDGPVYVR